MTLRMAASPLSRALLAQAPRPMPTLRQVALRGALLPSRWSSPSSSPSSSSPASSPTPYQGRHRSAHYYHSSAPSFAPQNYGVPASTSLYGTSSPAYAGGGSGYGGFGGVSSLAPPTYFARPSLPANTIIRFVPQQTAWLVERMGKFHRILQPGLAILIPFLDRIAYVKSLKENAIEIPSQSAITADNVTLELDGVLYTRVFDAYKASYGVEDADYAISQLAQTTMRSEIGQLTLDHVLKERAALNTNITAAINEAAQAWGVTCLRYEIRDIHAPQPVVEAMHRQVTAERSKRAEILESEGARQRAINLAEGSRQSVILASEAVKVEKVNQASGEAEAILAKARATAAGIEAVARVMEQGDASARAAVSLSVAERYVDAFGRLAKEGTAVVVPGNVGDIGGMIATALSVYGKIGEVQARSMQNPGAGTGSGAGAGSLGGLIGPSDGEKQGLLGDAKVLAEVEPRQR